MDAMNGKERDAPQWRLGARQSSVAQKVCPERDKLCVVWFDVPRSLLDVRCSTGNVEH